MRRLASSEGPESLAGPSDPAMSFAGTTSTSARAVFLGSPLPTSRLITIDSEPICKTRQHLLDSCSYWTGRGALLAPRARSEAALFIWGEPC